MKRVSYHREAWVGAEIENASRYGTSGVKSIAFDELLGVRFEMIRALGPSGCDIDHAERANRALYALPIDQARALLIYHTQRTLTQRQIARVLKVKPKKVDELLVLAHLNFCDGWDEAKWRAIHDDRHRPDRRASA